MLSHPYAAEQVVADRRCGDDAADGRVAACLLSLPLNTISTPFRD